MCCISINDFTFGLTLLHQVAEIYGEASTSYLLLFGAQGPGNAQVFYSLKWPKSQFRLDKSINKAIIKPILTFWPF